MKYPGKTFKRRCGATDGLGAIPGTKSPYGRCNLPWGHPGKWHQEWRGRKLWAEWRGPHPGEVCQRCGKTGGRH